MPKRNAPDGAPIWIELMTSDPDKSRAFYRALFGWESELNADFGDYINFSQNGELVAGGMQKQADQEALPDLWSIYLKSSDAQKTVDLATKNGGVVQVAPMAVGDLGTMAVVADAGGAMIGIWQPGTHAGIQSHAEPGIPSWFELHTRDYDKSVEFYKNVFGWQARAEGDSPDFRYTVNGQGDQQYAGIMDASGFLPEGVPAHWSVYVGTDDADKTLARAVELGGAVVQPVEDTPYGRLASATDVTGAAFKLVQGIQ